MHDDDLYLAHWGIKGMKWGVRKYRNEDGSLTEAGKSVMTMTMTFLLKNLKSISNYPMKMKLLKREP